MKLTRSDILEETNKKKRLFYHPPLAKKLQRVEAKPEPNGPIKKWTEEMIWLENLRRLSWKGEFEA